MKPITTDVLQTWDDVSRLEWLVTNGIGGYSSSSVSSANTRRYHGLLVSAFSPPVGRTVLLSKLEEEIRVEDELYQLSANKYPSVVQPQGHRHLTRFEADPVPTFTFTLHEDSVVIEKRIWMPYGKNTVYVEYLLVRAPESVRIGLIPLMAYKEYHSEQHKWDGFFGSLVQEKDGRSVFTAYHGAMPVYFWTPPSLSAQPVSGWFYNFEHPREQERGLDFNEDLFCPGRFDGTLAVGQSVAFVATVEPDKPASHIEALQAEVERQRTLISMAGLEKDAADPQRTLVRAADQFVIPRSDRCKRATVIAGYHWFTDWGRDTMIALPGLTLTTRRFDLAKAVLTSFAGSVRNGLLPNRFSDSGDGADYNTVDASLWYFHAVHQYAQASGDWDFATGTMLPVLADILQHHIDGTDYGIKVDPQDNLLSAGVPGSQLTWMDARVGDWVVTPRVGKPVEINALWYNALLVVADLYERSGDNVAAAEARTRAGQVKEAFNASFWDPIGAQLYDYIDPEGTPNASVRPNQIFAVSLPNPLIDGKRAKAVVDKVQSVLLTPYGLRTLSPDDPAYRPQYGPGDQLARDGSYHQGTVWPWLIGAFVDAHLSVYKDKKAALGFLQPLLDAMPSQYGVGSINEIFDADPPHAPNGCISQAWSVAEVLRVYSKLI